MEILTRMLRQSAWESSRLGMSLYAIPKDEDSTVPGCRDQVIKHQCMNRRDSLSGLKWKVPCTSSILSSLEYRSSVLCYFAVLLMASKYHL